MAEAMNRSSKVSANTHTKERGRAKQFETNEQVHSCKRASLFIHSPQNIYIDTCCNMRPRLREILFNNKSTSRFCRLEILSIINALQLHTQQFFFAYPPSRCILFKFSCTSMYWETRKLHPVLNCNWNLCE